MIPEIHVDLEMSPTQRWNLPPQLLAQAKELVCTYLKDLGGLSQFDGMLLDYARENIHEDIRGEIAAIAEAADCSFEEALLVNLYYDTLKFTFGCTAFAVNTEQGPLHARNLDWWTENDILRDYHSAADGLLRKDWSSRDQASEATDLTGCGVLVLTHRRVRIAT